MEAGCVDSQLPVGSGVLVVEGEEVCHWYCCHRVLITYYIQVGCSGCCPATDHVLIVVTVEMEVLCLLTVIVRCTVDERRYFWQLEAREALS